MRSASTVSERFWSAANQLLGRQVLGLSCIDIADIQVLSAQSKILWTEHVAVRLRERGIKRADVIECIANGEIIEQYPYDAPFPSCLILGKRIEGETLHLVVGLNKSALCCIITAYRPDLGKWEPDFKTRKDCRLL